MDRTDITQSKEERERLERTLDRLISRAKVGMPYKLSFLETQSIATFVLQLTAQNAELATSKAQLLAFIEEAGLDVPENAADPWSPMT